jgi:hypothetical protein
MRAIACALLFGLALISRRLVPHYRLPAIPTSSPAAPCSTANPIAKWKADGKGSPIERWCPCLRRPAQRATEAPSPENAIVKARRLI